MCQTEIQSTGRGIGAYSVQSRYDILQYSRPIVSAIPVSACRRKTRPKETCDSNVPSFAACSSSCSAIAKLVSLVS
jgi:hypothetical protein